MSLTRKVTRRVKDAWLAQLPLARLRDQLAQRRGTVFLCYHSLSPALASYPYRTTQTAFDTQLALLADIFDIQPANMAVQALRTGQPRNPSRPVAVICFDDGYRDNWHLATPVLERHGIPASLYVAHALIDNGGETFLSTSELMQLATHPLWEVGAHGMTHSVMTGLLPADQQKEMQQCKEWLTGLLGKIPAGFAYPMGQISPTAVDAARSVYDHAFSTDQRIGDTFDPWQIRRHCPSQTEDDPAAFLRMLLRGPWEGTQ